MLMTSIKRSSASFDCITHVYDVTNYYQLLAYKHSLEGGKGCACLALKLIGVQTTRSRFDKWLWTLFKISRLFSSSLPWHLLFILSLYFLNFTFFFSSIKIKYFIDLTSFWWWCQTCLKYLLFNANILIDRDVNIFIVFY